MASALCAVSLVAAGFPGDRRTSTCTLVPEVIRNDLLVTQTDRSWVLFNGKTIGRKIDFASVGLN